MFWFNRPLRLLGVIVLSVIVLTGCDQTSPLNVGDRDENGALRATSGGEPAWSQPTGDRTPYGCTFTELDGDLQPIGEEMYLALPPSLLAARVPAFEQHVKKGLDTKGKEIHLMFKWPSWYARPGETGDFQNAKDRTGPRFVARCLVPRLPVASSVSKAPAVPTPSVFSDVIRERIRPMMEERLQEIRAFRQDRPLGIRDVRPRDANGRVGPTKTAARQVGKSGTEVFGSLHELFDAATEEVISTYPNCSRVGIWYWMNADGTYEIESATCQAFAPPLGGGGSGVGGGDTCYDGPGSDPSLPLCELHPDDATEIVAEEAAWGVARRIGQKLLAALKRGEDLLDAKTWKNILESEWADAAQAGLDTQAALNGDVVALISVLDYIVSQISPAGGVFDMLQTLKLGDHLGLSWYDNIIGGLQTSQYFPQLAQAVGDFANTINDLSVLKQVGQLDDEANGAYRILEGDAGKVLDNFAEKWGTQVYLRADGNWEVLKPGGSVRMTQYRSGSVIDGQRRPTINLNESGSTQKIRFGDSKYPFE